MMNIKAVKSKIVRPASIEFKNLIRAFFVICFLAYPFTPYAVYILLGINLALCLFLYVLRFVFLPKAQTFHEPKLKWLKGDNRDFVSIHVPICNEPPELVLKTLRSLSQIDYVSYEVIVLSNNTKDKALWLPIKLFCSAQGTLFKFHHIDEVKGFKAGALNLCLDLSNPKAKYIMTVDADYEVSGRLLNHGITKMKLEKLSFLQFPQSYSNGIENKNYLEKEYAHFFQLYMLPSAEKGATLLTGTLSLIEKSALERIGGWDSSSVTEDAKTSLKLLLAGMKGSYEHLSAGRGVMPMDMTTLRKQRQRWSLGNAQTLFSLNLNSIRGLGRAKLIMVLLQLTAWQDFLLIPFLFFIFNALNVLFLGESIDGAVGAELLAASSIVLSLLLKATFFLIKLKSVLSFKEILRVFLVSVGLAFESNLGWVKSLGVKAQTFVRTNKFIMESDKSALVPHVTVGLVSIVVAVILFSEHRSLSSLSILAMSIGVLLGAKLLDEELKEMTKAENHKRRHT